MKKWWFSSVGQREDDGEDEGMCPCDGSGDPYQEAVFHTGQSCVFANRFAKGVWETDGNRQSQLEIDMLMGGYSSEQRPQRLYPGEQWESLTPEGRTQKPGESQVLDTQCKGTVGKQEENSMPPPRFSNQLDVGRHTVWGTQLNQVLTMQCTVVYFSRFQCSNINSYIEIVSIVSHQRK